MAAMSDKRFPSGIMCTCCVPWDVQFHFAEAIFRRNVRQALSATPHVYVFGTAGEGYAVSERQFDEVVAAFADEMRKAAAEAAFCLLRRMARGVAQSQTDRRLTR